MSIGRLVVNSINHNRTRIYTAKHIKGSEILITYRLSIPSWVNDLEMIKDDKTSILYAKTKTTYAYTVDIKNVSDGYPKVGNNKYLCINKCYDVTSWLQEDLFFQKFLSEEREKIFREIRSDIMLQQIGDLSNKWKNVTEGIREDYLAKLPYGKSKLDWNVEERINGKRVVKDEEKSSSIMF